jgi:hypothetical protein
MTGVQLSWYLAETHNVVIMMLRFCSTVTRDINLAKGQSNEQFTALASCDVAVATSIPLALTKLVVVHVPENLAPSEAVGTPSGLFLTWNSKRHALRSTLHRITRARVMASALSEYPLHRPLHQ